MAKPSPSSAPTTTAAPLPRLLVLELWGLGDLALALPFLRAATAHYRVTLVAPPHAAPLLNRFAPAVDLLPFSAPWTAFTGKYRLHRWPWPALAQLRRTLRELRFDLAVSARPDPRDHFLLALSGAPRRVGFPRAGSGLLLSRPLPAPSRPHRADHWAALAADFGFPLAAPAPAPRPGRRIVIHAGAARAVRRWPLDRFQLIADQMRADGWNVVLLDDSLRDLDRLLDELSAADRFIGNDSGPGHLAALLGVPTFTIFGPQLPELFAPQHPQAAWIEGAPCPHKPCFDACRFPAPRCILDLGAAEVSARIKVWLDRG